MKHLLWVLVLGIFMSCSVDEEPEPMVTAPIVSVEDIIVEEGNDNKFVFVRLVLNKQATELGTVYISSEDVTAEAGVDYVAFDNVPVVFEQDDLVKEYRIEIIGDIEEETNEIFNVKIESAEGLTIGDNSGTVTIQTDDNSSTGIVVPSTGYTTPENYAGMDLLWRDEFNGTSIDESKWNFEIGTGSNGWGNNELQYYRKENAFIIEDDYLVIDAKEEAFSGRQYTSTRMTTQGKFDFAFGRVDIRANLPTGQGIWPALWMLGANFSSVGWPSCGEIDIMEIIGSKPSTLHGTTHWSDDSNNYASYGGETTLPSGIFKDNFHVFSIVWDSSKIRWLLDDVEYHVIDISPSGLSEFRSPHFFIFNVAVGGNWPGSPNNTTEFPQQMIVDYIRVFK